MVGTRVGCEKGSCALVFNLFDVHCHDAVRHATRETDSQVYYRCTYGVSTTTTKAFPSGKHSKKRQFSGISKGSGVLHFDASAKCRGVNESETPNLLKTATVRSSKQQPFHVSLTVTVSLQVWPKESEPGTDPLISQLGEGAKGHELQRYPGTQGRIADSVA
eukprot:388540-Rhodomonas_salina.1